MDIHLLLTLALAIFLSGTSGAPCGDCCCCCCGNSDTQTDYAEPAEERSETRSPAFVQSMFQSLGHAFGNIFSNLHQGSQVTPAAIPGAPSEPGADSNSTAPNPSQQFAHPLHPVHQYYPAGYATPAPSFGHVPYYQPQHVMKTSDQMFYDVYYN